MTLDQIPIGQAVTVEVTFGESRIEFQSEVVGFDGPGIYIKPYIFKGTAIDFKALNYSDLLYNIHTVDDNGMRTAWKSVEVQIRKFKGEDHYLVHAKGFLKFSQPSERRGDSRLKISVGGRIVLKDGRQFACSLYDISDSGIAFLCTDHAFTPADQLQLSFFDYAMDQEFSLSVMLRIVRASRIPQGNLYAGRIIFGQKEILGYICLKRMEIKAEEKRRLRAQ